MHTSRKLVRKRGYSQVILAATTVALCSARAALAQDNWNAGDGNWSNPANWSPANVPGAGDTVNIIETDGVDRTITYDYTGAAVTLNSLTLDLTNATGTASSILSMSANNLTANSEYVGDSGSGSNGIGSFNQNGGINTLASVGLYLGYNSTDTGTYSLSGSGSFQAIAPEFIGGFGTGVFNQSGGTNALNGVAYLAVGAFTGSNGTYTLSGGVLTASGGGASTEYIGAGANSTGIFNQTGGSNTANFNGQYLGSDTGSTGTYDLSGTGKLIVSTEYVGNLGTGVFNQSGGTSSLGYLYLGGDPNINGATATGTGTFTLSGTGNLSSQFEQLGNGGPGIFNQTGGINNLIANGALLVGSVPRSTGTYTLSGTGSIVGGAEYVGNNGDGIFIQSGGTNTISAGTYGPNPLVVGLQAGETGTYTLSGTGAISVSGDEVVGDGGVGIFNQSGGTNVVANEFDMGESRFSNATYNLSSGSLTVQGSAYIGGSGPLESNAAGGTALLTVSGSGTLSVTNTVMVYGSGQLNINGGTASAATLDLLGSYTQTTGTATFAQITGTGAVTVSGGLTTLTSKGGASQMGLLNVSGPGTLDLTNNSLAINYGIGKSPEAAIEVAIASAYNGGAWNGAGITSSTAAANGAYALGYADGTLDTDTTAAANQVLVKYTLIGDANLDGTVNLTDLLALLNNYGQTGRDWAEGDFNYDGTVNLTDLLALLNNYGQTAVITSASLGGTQVVPEPVTACVLATTGLGLLARRRRGRWLPCRKP